jgi:predicted dehydrogenase
MTEFSPLRIGVLGAARITPLALIRPARSVPEVTVAAVAARNRARAGGFAARHGIPVVHSGYADVVDDPTLQAVYIPLPNSLHAEWTQAALAAGKHVLCEKPMTANADEARAVAAAADASGLVVMEAFHYRYHPLMARALDLVGEVGTIRHVETRLCFPLPKFDDIRYNRALAGGAAMDAGCYAIHALRTLGGATPSVVSAVAKTQKPDVDRYMSVSFVFPDGATGRATASMWSSTVLGISAKVIGDAGELRIFNFIMPHVYHRLTLKLHDSSTRRERVAGGPTYGYQLRAFADAVLRGGPVLTPAADAVVNMSLVDDAYRAAGLAPR